MHVTPSTPPYSKPLIFTLSWCMFLVHLVIEIAIFNLLTQVKARKKDKLLSGTLNLGLQTCNQLTNHLAITLDKSLPPYSPLCTVTQSNALVLRALHCQSLGPGLMLQTVVFPFTWVSRLIESHSRVHNGTILLCKRCSRAILASCICRLHHVEEAHAGGRPCNLGTRLGQPVCISYITARRNVAGL